MSCKNKLKSDKMYLFNKKEINLFIKCVLHRKIITAYLFKIIIYKFRFRQKR